VIRVGSFITYSTSSTKTGVIYEVDIEINFKVKVYEPVVVIPPAVNVPNN
jgi:hypothetical protein